MSNAMARALQTAAILPAFSLKPRQDHSQERAFGASSGLTRATAWAGSDCRSLTCSLALRLRVMWSLRTSSWKPSGVVSRFVRKVRTASGAVAVQVVTRRGRQAERIEHVGSAHTDAELALLLVAARERLSPGQDVLDRGTCRWSRRGWTRSRTGPANRVASAAGGRRASRLRRCGRAGRGDVRWSALGGLDPRLRAVGVRRPGR